MTVEESERMNKAKERRRLEHKNRIENGIKLQHMHIVEQRKEARQRQKELNK